MQTSNVRHSFSQTRILTSHKLTGDLLGRGEPSNTCRLELPRLRIARAIAPVFAVVAAILIAATIGTAFAAALRAAAPFQGVALDSRRGRGGHRSHDESQGNGQSAKQFHKHEILTFLIDGNAHRRATCPTELNGGLQGRSSAKNRSHAASGNLRCASNQPRTVQNAMRDVGKEARKPGGSCQLAIDLPLEMQRCAAM